MYLSFIHILYFPAINNKVPNLDSKISGYQIIYTEYPTIFNIIILLADFFRKFGNNSSFEKITNLLFLQVLALNFITSIILKKRHLNINERNYIILYNYAHTQLELVKMIIKFLLKRNRL